MKPLLFAVLLLCSLPVFGQRNQFVSPSGMQVTNRVAVGVQSSATLPSTCTYGAGNVSLYYKTGASAGFYTCNSASTGWDGPYSTSSGTPGGSNTQIQYNNSSAFGGISGATTDGAKITLSTPLTSTQGTITTSTPFLTHTATWNAAGVAFTNIFSNVTDTASATGSLLMDLQVGSASKFSITKAGAITAAGNVGSGGNVTAGASSSFKWSGRSLLTSSADGSFRCTDSTAATNCATTLGSGTFTGAVGFSDGTVGAPGIKFTSQTGGWFSRGIDGIWAYGNGTTNLIQLYTAQGIAMQRDLTFEWSSSDPTNAATDTGIARGSAGVVNVTTGSGAGTGSLTAKNITSSAGVIKLASYIVSGLPSASTSGAGSMAYVTDSTATAITGLGLAVVGGSTNKVVVVSDGTNWIIL